MTQQKILDMVAIRELNMPHLRVYAEPFGIKGTSKEEIYAELQAKDKELRDAGEPGCIADAIKDANPPKQAKSGGTPNDVKATMQKYGVDEATAKKIVGDMKKVAPKPKYNSADKTERFECSCGKFPGPARVATDHLHCGLCGKSAKEAGWTAL